MQESWSCHQWFPEICYKTIQYNSRTCWSYLFRIWVHVCANGNLPKKTIQIISIHQPKQRNKNNSHSNKKKHEFIQKPPRFSSINPAPFTVNTAIGESLHFLFVIFRFQVADEGAESPSAAVNSWPTWKAPSNASEGGKSGFQVVIITGRGSNPCQVIGLEHFTKANKKLQKQK